MSGRFLLYTRAMTQRRARKSPEVRYGSWAALRGCAASVRRTFSTGHHGTGLFDENWNLENKGPCSVHSAK